MKQIDLCVGVTQTKLVTHMDGSAGEYKLTGCLDQQPLSSISCTEMKNQIGNIIWLLEGPKKAL